MVVMVTTEDDILELQPHIVENVLKAIQRSTKPQTTMSLNQT